MEIEIRNLLKTDEQWMPRFLLIFILFTFGCKSAKNVKVIYFEDFSQSQLPADYFVEGTQKVSLVHGRLMVDANPDDNEEYATSTVWLNRVFSGDLKVEFDAHVVSSIGEKNNINFFPLFSDSTGKPLSETSQDRVDAAYKKYHKLNGYVFTYLANGRPDTARFRMRDDPGFHLLQEVNAYECKIGKTYHIEIIKKGPRLTFAVDGKVYMDVIDDQFNAEHKSGLLGFRTWRTELWWDNLRVTQL